MAPPAVSRFPWLQAWSASPPDTGRDLYVPTHVRRKRGYIACPVVCGG